MLVNIFFYFFISRPENKTFEKILFAVFLLLEVIIFQHKNQNYFSQFSGLTIYLSLVISIYTSKTKILQKRKLIFYYLLFLAF